MAGAGSLVDAKLRENGPDDGVDDARIGHLEYCCSMAPILRTRRKCLSSVQRTVRKVVTISGTAPGATNFAPSVSTLASLCSRAFLADATSLQSAARTPGTLLAAIAEPMPAASTRIP